METLIEITQDSTPETTQKSSTPLPAGGQGILTAPMRERMWKPGQSGNPLGKPKDAVDLQRLAKTQTKDAVATLVKWMHSSEGRFAIPAAIALLDRGWGRPRESKDAAEIVVDGWDTMSHSQRIAVLRAQRKGNARSAQTTESIDGVSLPTSDRVKPAAWKA